MIRVFIEGRLAVGEVTPLSPSQAHHLKNVVRLSTHDSVILVDESGCEFRAEIAWKRGRDMALTVVEEIGSPPPPVLSIGLFAGLMKGNRMERLVRDAAALGVESITPFTSCRTIPRDIGDIKLERMKTIAVEESSLSGRNRPLVVRPPVTFAEALRSEADLSLFVWENETSDIREALRACPAAPSRVSIYTGPEGGFSADEASAALAAGLVSVGLGPRIIRAETAPLVAAVIVQYEWGDL